MVKTTTTINRQIEIFQHVNKYAKYLPEVGRRETWEETVDRVVNWFKKRYPSQISQDVWAILHSAFLNEECSFSMRAVQMAGPALDRCEVAAYNCAFTPIEKLEDFSQILYILMQGTGCAFSVEKVFTSKLPGVLPQAEREIKQHVVGDSTEDWCRALEHGLACWFNGRDVVFDTSLVRPSGSRLTTKGGYASGPGPLVELLKFVRTIVLDAQGRQLRPFEVHRIACKIGKIVEVGGVRRAAMLCLSDLDDAEMAACKSGEFWEEYPELTMANNSAAYTGPLDLGQFEREWEALKASGSGERGIFNRVSALGRRKSFRFGTNPCVTADTWVFTSNGPMQVKDLVGQDHKTIVNGEVFEATGFWETGIKPVFKVTTDNGYSVTATNDHKVLTTSGWLEVGQLVPGVHEIVMSKSEGISWPGRGTEAEGWLLGNLFGDGNVTTTTANLDYWGDDRYYMRDLASTRIKSSLTSRSDVGSGEGQIEYNRVRLGSRGLLGLAKQYDLVSQDGFKQISSTLEATSSDFTAGFLRGWFDADGSPQGCLDKGYSVRLSSVDLQGLYMAQRMLARLGVVSKVYANRKDAGWKTLPNNKGLGESELYWCQAQHELVISRTSIKTFEARVGFDDPTKKVTLRSMLASYTRPMYADRFSSVVVSVDTAGSEPVYDCTVDEAHMFDGNGLVVHNCGEIILRPRQFCNLSIAIIRPTDTKDSIRRKVAVATIMGTLQAGLTKFGYIEKAWKTNSQEEALLGVDLLGALDNPLLQDEAFLSELRNLVVDVNSMFAQDIGIQPSAATTCIKPGGNSGERFGTGNSLSGWHSKYIKRRVRVNLVDPMCQFLIDQGLPHEPDYANKSQIVFDFLKVAPDTAVFRKDQSALDQLNWWLKLKTFWTEHNPSTTIYIRPDEWDTVKNWIVEHWDSVGGLAFLPYNDSVYQQAPFEELTQEAFEAALASYPEIDWNKFKDYELNDTTSRGQDFACLGGVCEI